MSQQNIIDLIWIIFYASAIISLISVMIWGHYYLENPHKKALKYSIKGNKLIYRYLKKHTNFDQTMYRLNKFEDFKGVFFSIKIIDGAWETTKTLEITSLFVNYEVQVLEKKFKWKEFKILILGELITAHTENILFNDMV